MMSITEERDHGGNLDTALARHGGERGDWLDLSTGINPMPYRLPEIVPEAWTTLPDREATAELVQAARAFWQVPEKASVLAAPGLSILISRIPGLFAAGRVRIMHPTYNEHAAAFRHARWQVTGDVDGSSATARVVVHPNNPDGALWSPTETDRDECRLLVIDESFCDVMPEMSHVGLTSRPGVLVLKGMGKFWGLAGMRLGFAIGDPALTARLADELGPWPVSGPALAVGTAALQDHPWAENTRIELARSARELDRLLEAAGARAVGGTTLFRLYEVGDARTWQDRLAGNHVWTRTFPYSRHWIRLGLPAPDRWHQLESALFSCSGADSTPDHTMPGGRNPE